MGWAELNTFVKLPDHHPDDPHQWFAVFVVRCDGTCEIVGYLWENPIVAAQKGAGE